jgi:hypothetical protein
MVTGGELASPIHPGKIVWPWAPGVFGAPFAAANELISGGLQPQGYTTSLAARLGAGWAALNFWSTTQNIGDVSMYGLSVLPNWLVPKIYGAEGLAAAKKSDVIWWENFGVGAQSLTIMAILAFLLNQWYLSKKDQLELLKLRDDLTGPERFQRLVGGHVMTFAPTAIAGAGAIVVILALLKTFGEGALRDIAPGELMANQGHRVDTVLQHIVVTFVYMAVEMLARVFWRGRM